MLFGKKTNLYLIIEHQVAKLKFLCPYHLFDSVEMEYFVDITYHYKS